MIALLLRSASKTGEPALLEEDEMDYSLKLNKELPPDIRVLAWCTVPADFSARHAFTLPCPALPYPALPCPALPCPDSALPTFSLPLSHMLTQRQQPSHSSIVGFVSRCKLDSACRLFA